MPLSSPRFFYIVLLPLTVALLITWLCLHPVIQTESKLDGAIGGLQKILTATGYGNDPAGLEKHVEELTAENARLHEITQNACALSKHPLVTKYGAQPFQLIEFEQERVAATNAVKEAANAAKVNVADSAFAVLNELVAATNPDHSRRRWAQLALAKITAERAIAAKVATYEALPLPNLREIRLDSNSPVLFVEVSFCARVTGGSAAVQNFIEKLVLGTTPEKSDTPLLLEHVALRKEGATIDNASATIVVSALLNAPSTTAAEPKN